MVTGPRKPLIDAKTNGKLVYVFPTPSLLKPHTAVQEQFPSLPEDLRLHPQVLWWKCTVSYFCFIYMKNQLELQRVSKGQFYFTLGPSKERTYCLRLLKEECEGECSLVSITTFYTLSYLFIWSVMYLTVGEKSISLPHPPAMAVCLC